MRTNLVNFTFKRT